MWAYPGTHSHTPTHPHTHTCTPHLTFRPSVENTSVCKLGEDICTAGTRRDHPFASRLDYLGFLSIPTPTPHLDHDIRKSG